MSKYSNIRKNYIFDAGMLLRKKYPDTWKSELQELNLTMKIPLTESELTDVIGRINAAS